MQAWFNGQILPENKITLSVTDEGLKYGNGIFETLPITAGQPQLLAAHLARMAGASSALDFRPAAALHLLPTAIDDLIAINKIADGVLRIYQTAGGSLWATTSAGIPYPPEMTALGITATISPIRRNEFSPLCAWKTFNYLDNILAKRAAAAQGFGEALLLNSRGWLAEGSVSNLWLVKADRLITPSAASGLLPGIIRGEILKMTAHWPIEEREVDPGELYQAEECFLTNSLMGIMPLIQVDGQNIGSGQAGPVTAQLRQQLPLNQPAEK